MKINEKIIWITGASSGIGSALAIEMSKYNTKLILSSRNEEELSKIKEICEKNNSVCYVKRMDLSRTEEIDIAVKDILSKFGKVDILINNGGISQRSYAYETDFDVYRRVMEVNFFGNIYLTQKLLPSMIKNNSGHLVAVSSIVGKFGFPLRSAYSASKHALMGYYETLYFELNKTNIKVSIVLPGRINTNVSKNSLTKDGTKYDKMDAGQAGGMPAEQCAKKFIRGIEKDKKEILIGGKELFMVHLKRFVPYFFNKITNKIKPT